MPVRDAAATRARILSAAIDEFAAYGLAGARVDRIAETANANKRAIYAYFGDKDTLFATALHHVVGQVAEAVPLDVNDLPGYAGQLFDHLLEHPEAWRLGMWLVLERPPAGPDETDFYADKLAAIGGKRRTSVNGIPATDLIVIIIGLVRGWFMSPEGLLAADGPPATAPERIATHRAAIVEAVRRMTSSTPAP
ncbi:TetR family transcriptional regulator [Conexibacter woesei]|uniref:Transcriptional regulator, TetR family n=1 Tax=Conexibacter woesei (strain DSM 14684 / CCUG 47730 / CIP 108061 / JCM 11494 / NBRC 100937 / ID131577) TaxID=469383 RepID=D3F4D5_CONWI|nr:TetR family transcriptional regulator [Conexibacter woesei]ADB50507.1 transcriptional regulator, TetR family [Conexibacter woesei DSM 14684]